MESIALGKRECECVYCVFETEIQIVTFQCCGVRTGDSGGSALTAESDVRSECVKMCASKSVNVGVRFLRQKAVWSKACEGVC